MKRIVPIVIIFLAWPALGLPGEETTPMKNLLQNPGFEEGDASPKGWGTFPREGQGIRYVWDSVQSRSGRRSAGIEGDGEGFGMWQQIVDVEPGKVYALTAYVAFEDLAPPGQCCLQLVFRDAKHKIIKMIYWPGHTGRREFALDFPVALKVRAPAGAARVEVNLFLRGKGKAWFDDVLFAPVPTGEIAGAVSSNGRPLAGARVCIWGDPWDKVCEAFTDSEGRYTLTGIPVAFPRYVLLAAKTGYRTRPAGDVEVREGAAAAADFDLDPGSNPDDLHVKFGTLALQKFVRGARIPDGAVIPADASDYPEAVRPFLTPDEYIQSDHPDVAARAKQIVDALPAEDRKDTRKVVWAVYEWITRNIDHDGVFAVAGQGGLETPFRDVTSGIWQTISPRGWGWGKSFLDWCYRPDEVLKVKCAICVEHAWLFSAMLRSVNIPARASVGSMEYWAQSTMKDGVWIHGSTTGGRTSFRERGLLGPGFEGPPPETRFSVLSRPILHEDWDAQNKGLWRERHPWGERYEASEAGHRQALADLTRFAETGEAPRTGARPRGGRGTQPPRAQEQEDLATQRQGPPPPPGDSYVIHYSDVTISLLNMSGQRILDVRFPMVSATGADKPKPENKFWTNHPECVKRTRVEEITNPPAQGAERWFHIAFDLSTLLGQR